MKRPVYQDTWGIPAGVLGLVLAALVYSVPVRASEGEKGSHALIAVGVPTPSAQPGQDGRDTNAPQRRYEPGEPPILPVGLDAYRQWERWPYQRLGVRAYMRSTYDRRGGNEGADASHFLYQLADDFNVSLDVAGPGVLYFARYNHWHGSPWHYEVDGVDHIVRETGTADPVNAKQTLKETVFLPEAVFPNPLAWTWSTTKGADLMWVPLPFEQTFRMAYSRTRYGTGYYIYHLYDRSAPLSQPIRSWDAKTPPAQDVLDLLNRAGTDLAPHPGTPEGDRLGVKELSGEVSLARASRPLRSPRSPAHRDGAGGRVLRAQRTGPCVRPRAFAHHVGRTGGAVDRRPGGPVLRRRHALQPRGTRVPGQGFSHPHPLLQKTACTWRATSRCHSSSRHGSSLSATPMPSLTSSGGCGIIRWMLRPTQSATSTPPIATILRRNRARTCVLLDTREVEGGGEWSGSFVGTSWIFSHRGVLNTLEGDPRFFFDDSQTPQAQGTGTEEWGGGGDYWGGLNMTLPLAGHPCGARSAKEAKGEEDLIESAYRFLLADLMPFGRRAVIRLEHGGENQSTEHYETVAYWYGAPFATLVPTDELRIGDIPSERMHLYSSPQAGEPYEITSRYEWGPDTLAGKEIYSPHSDLGRKTTGVVRVHPEAGPTEFRRAPATQARLFFPEPACRGLRGQETGGSIGEFQPAGIWYLAGSNTCVYSNPKEELGATQHNVQTSNRRFRDDEFLVPRELTRGRAQVRIRIRFTPVEIPLFPGHPLPELAWSEIRYTAYCYVMPQMERR